jgi:hypothetical protein
LAAGGGGFVAATVALAITARLVSTEVIREVIGFMLLPSR